MSDFKLGIYLVLTWFFLLFFSLSFAEELSKKSKFPTYKECMEEKDASPHVCAVDEAIAFSLKHKNGVAIYVNYAAMPELDPKILEENLATALREEQVEHYKITSSFSRFGKATVMQVIVDGVPIRQLFVNADARKLISEAAILAKGGAIKVDDY